MGNLLQLDRFLPYRLSVTSNLVSDRIARAYESMFGLTIPEWRIVALLAEAAPITQAVICDKSRMDKVTVSRAAISVVSRGLAIRSPNAADRRSHLLSLTEDGHTLYAAIAPKALELAKRLFSGFDEADLTHFTEMLARIDAAAIEVGR